MPEDELPQTQLDSQEAEVQVEATVPYAYDDVQLSQLASLRSVAIQLEEAEVKAADVIDVGYF